MKEKNIANHTRNVDAIIVDDDKLFVDSVVIFLESKGKTVVTFHNANDLLESVMQFAKTTKIFLDNNLGKNMTGVGLAIRLHEQGYTALYLFTGQDMAEEDIPSYLTLIVKTNLRYFEQIIG